MAKEKLHIYLRVSSKGQEDDGTSLETQEEVARGVAKQLNMTPVVHNEGGKSSKYEDIDNRPVLQDILYRGSKGEIDHLWCWEIDRIARGDMPQALFRKTLRDYGILLYQKANTHPLDISNPQDEFLLSVLGAAAKMDNAMRAARSRQGKIHRTKQGYWHGGAPVYGYEIKDKKLSIEKNEAKVVKEIHERYAKGETLSEIRDRLFSKGIMTRRGKVSWSDRTLQLILTSNTHYDGYYVVDYENHKPIRVECPRILVPELIEATQAEHKKRSRVHGGRQRNTGRQKRVFLLRDYLYCGDCGSRYGATSKPNKRIEDYYCLHSQRTYREVDREVCGSPRNSINITETDVVVMDAICQILSESNLFREQIKQEVLGSNETLAQTETKIRSTQKRIKETKKEIAKVDDQILNLETDKLLGTRSASDIKTIYKKLEQYKRDKTVQLQNYELSIDGLHYSAGWLDWVKQFGNRLDDMRSGDKSVEEKKVFIGGILDRIDVSFSDKQTAHLDIHLLYPYVGDKLTYKDRKDKRKGYTLSEGKKTAAITHTITQKKKGRPRKERPPDEGK